MESVRVEAADEIKKVVGAFTIISIFGVLSCLKSYNIQSCRLTILVIFL